MARGITENDVHKAADVLVSAGERPTVDRIRAHMGTGSPNTVTRWLETWWRQLGPRLQSQALHVALPEAPETVSRLAGQLWSQALDEARRHAEAALQQDRIAFAQERERQQDEWDAAIGEVMDARKGANEARAERDLALAQSRELQQLVDQLKAQTADLATQRDGAQRRVDRLEAELLGMSARFEELKADGDREREAMEAHRRAFEDRAHREIDLARQAVKELRAELSAGVKARELRESALTSERENALRALALTQNDLSAQRARADTLEAQLARLVKLSHGGSGDARTRSKRAKSPVQKALVPKQRQD